MHNINSRLLYTIALIFVLPFSVFGQNLTETFQKLVWHEAPRFSLADWESRLPNENATTINYSDDQQLEVFETNENGFPILVTLFSTEALHSIPQLKSEVAYAPNGHLSDLVIFEWRENAWVPNSRFKRNFDAAGNDYSFTMETWEDANWANTYSWTRSPEFTLSASISASANP